MIENPGDAVGRNIDSGDKINTLWVDSTNSANVSFSYTWGVNGPQTFDDAVKQIAQEIAEVVISKQNDYGPGNILDAPFNPEVGLVVRLWDKVSRLKHLAEQGTLPNNESVEDTYRDIIGYSLIWFMLQRDWFELPLKLQKDN